MWTSSISDSARIFHLSSLNLDRDLARCQLAVNLFVEQSGHNQTHQPFSRLVRRVITRAKLGDFHSEALARGSSNFVCARSAPGVTNGIISPWERFTKVFGPAKRWRAGDRIRRGEFSSRRQRVTDGTRTRNSQNHNLELYH